MINSALVSAQNRKRVYWTNIKGIEQPDDLRIVWKDVLEHSPVGDKYRISSDSKFIPKDITTSVIDPYNKKCVSPDKSTTLRLNHSNGNCWVADTQMQKGCICIPEATKKGYVEAESGDGVDLTFPNSKTRRGRLMRDKCNNLTGNPGEKYGVIDQELSWRKLTPLECERLQTVPDNYTSGVSNSQRYKMLGNGWTVDVIAHILKGLL
jgi:DNA (cytosine-5)-methyltransferase 3A